MSSELAHLAPHLLGIFMITLACVPLVFVLQDRHRSHVEKSAVGRLRREASVTAELRGRHPSSGPAMGGMSRG